MVAKHLTERVKRGEWLPSFTLPCSLLALLCYLQKLEEAFVQLLLAFTSVSCETKRRLQGNAFNSCKKQLHKSVAPVKKSPFGFANDK